MQNLWQTQWFWFWDCKFSIWLGMFLVKHPTSVYISQLIRFVRVSSHVTDFNTHNKLLTAKLLNQGYRYLKHKFYRLRFNLVSKFNVGLKSLLQQGLSEPEFYSQLVKNQKIYSCHHVGTQFRKIILRYIKNEYNINVIRQTACMVVNQITVKNFAFVFYKKSGKYMLAMILAHDFVKPFFDIQKLITT